MELIMKRLLVRIGILVCILSLAAGNGALAAEKKAGAGKKDDKSAKQVAADKAKAQRQKEKEQAIAKAKAQQREGDAKAAREAKAKAAQEKKHEEPVKKVELVSLTVERGALTPDELALLAARQKNLERLSKTIRQDGAIKGTEYTGLRAELNRAASSIWAATGKSAGSTKYEFGTDVVFKDWVGKGLEERTLEAADVEKVIGGFVQVISSETRLATQYLAAELRDSEQKKLNQLANAYFQKP
jgi:hypothetical protein